MSLEKFLNGSFTLSQLIVANIVRLLSLSYFPLLRDRRLNRSIHSVTFCENVGKTSTMPRSCFERNFVFPSTERFLRNYARHKVTRETSTIIRERFTLPSRYPENYFLILSLNNRPTTEDRFAFSMLRQTVGKMN